MALRHISISDQIPTIKVNGQFTLPENVLEGTEVLLLLNGSGVHTLDVTMTSQTEGTIACYDTDLFDDDELEVVFDNEKANLTINCGPISNHILPIKAQIINYEEANGQIINGSSINACVDTLNEIDAEVANLFYLQAKAVNEQEIFAIIEKC
jgi:hypothetical protein